MKSNHISVSEFTRHSLRMAAIHEAGHAVAAVAAGIPRAKATLSRVREKHPSLATVVQGQAHTFGARTKWQDAIIGFAGVAAEELAENDEATAEDIALKIGFSAVHPSLSDWISITALNGRKREEALEATIKILRQKWHAVTFLADSLVNQCNSNRGAGTVDFDAATLAGIREPEPVY